MDTAFYNILQAIGYGHPLHPVLTHLVIGPVIAALLFALLGWFANKPVFLRTARHMTGLAFIFWFLAVAVGVLDWVHFYGASVDIPQIQIKVIFALILLVILVTTLVVNRFSPENSKRPIILYLLAVVCVIVIGFEGGDLVFGSHSSLATALNVA